jgi:hypothetical protein
VAFRSNGGQWCAAVSVLPQKAICASQEALSAAAIVGVALFRWFHNED